MDDRFFELGRAGDARAAGHGFSFGFVHLGAANRTPVGNAEFLFLPGPLFQHHLDHFGDHVSGPLDDHRVPDADVLAVDFILIVQSRPADLHAPHADRIHEGRRSKGAGPADLNDDIPNLGRRLFGFEFECQGPARAPGDGPQRFLKAEGIHLDDHAVDFVGQLFPEFVHPAIKLDDLPDLPASASPGIDLESPAIQSLEQVPMGFK